MDTTEHIPVLVRPIADISFNSALFRARVQKGVGYLFLLPFCGLIVLLYRALGRYHIPNLKAIRKQFQECTSDDSPLLICSNHLTFIDSAVLIWAFASNFWYLFHYKKFMWNLPAGDFFKKKFTFRLVAYLSKCLFLHRDGSSDHKNTILKLCIHLLKEGELVTIFPEGTRSRSGRFQSEKLTKGVGKIVCELGHCRVLCVYIRSDKQETFSNYPAKNSRFYVDMKLVTPNFTEHGKAGYAEVTRQIGDTIKHMEERYFGSRH